MVDRDRREELAKFLRSRRQRVRPAEVGFPAGLHRRTAGLRREEVAVLAGVSPTWYTYLEQARDIKPSPEVLDSLARVLRLSEDERRYMHVLAYGHTPPGEPASPPQPSINQVVRQLVELFGQVDLPVYAVDEVADLIAWNTSATEWYTDFGKLPDGKRNMIWWLMTGADARDRIVNWEQDARNIVARFRAGSAIRAGDERLARLVRELGRASPEFARWWVEHDVQGQRLRPRRLCHPVLGQQSMRLQVLTPTETAGAMIVFHLPVGDRQAAAMLEAAEAADEASDR